MYIQKIWRGYYTRKILTYYLEMLEKGELELLEDMDDGASAPEQLQNERQAQGNG